jgi:hypothetical protein
MATPVRGLTGWLAGAPGHHSQAVRAGEQGPSATRPPGAQLVRYAPSCAPGGRVGELTTR